jgi:hypothetical protein
LSFWLAHSLANQPINSMGQSLFKKLRISQLVKNSSNFMGPEVYTLFTRSRHNSTVSQRHAILFL